MTLLTNYVRSKGDPKIIETGPSVVPAADTLARYLGYFSIGLGLTQLFSPRRVTRPLGLHGMEGWTRLYGLREIAAGFLLMGPDKTAGAWARTAGDAVDIATLVYALDRRNPMRGNVKAALLAVAAVTALDAIVASALTAQHSRAQGRKRDYRDRTGFPKGLHAARAFAKAQPVSETVADGHKRHMAATTAA